jgi:hypothetical protein
MCTAEPFVPELSTFEVVVTIGKLKRCESPGYDQISAELIQAGWGGGTLHSEVNKRIMLKWNKDEFPHWWKESSVVPVHKQDDETGCHN